MASRSQSTTRLALMAQHYINQLDSKKLDSNSGSNSGSKSGISKSAFVPMPPEGDPGMDPAMGGAPMDPMAGGAPPMAPGMDPAMGGAPPMDPMAGGAPPVPSGPPSHDIKTQIKEVMEEAGIIKPEKLSPEDNTKWLHQKLDAIMNFLQLPIPEKPTKDGKGGEGGAGAGAEGGASISPDPMAGMADTAGVPGTMGPGTSGGASLMDLGSLGDQPINIGGAPSGAEKAAAYGRGNYGNGSQYGTNGRSNSRNRALNSVISKMRSSGRL